MDCLQNFHLAASLYTVTGLEFTIFGTRVPPILEDRTQMAAFQPNLTSLVASGAIKPNPIKLWPGGLDSIWEGLQYLKEGKNSGEKLVCKI